MPRKNYSKISEKKEEVPEVVEEVKEIVETPVEEIKEEMVEIPVEEVNLVDGKVNGCEALNIRKKPTINSDVADVIKKDSKVTVYLKDSTEDFYKIMTSKGVEGYCMKKFIKIN